MLTTRPELRGTHGMVASTHWLASAAGMAMLERGGNAFDAAAAAGFVLQVVEPHLNGPGGDCVTLMHDAKSRQALVICGQGVAPATATIERYWDLGLRMVPGTGLLSAVVPGAFDSWMLMLRDYGSMRLAEVMEPALVYAAKGCPLVPQVCGAIESVQGLFRDAWPSSAAVYLPDGRAPRSGALFSNPTLGQTFARLIAEAMAAGGNREAEIEAARTAWYTGFVAEAIDRFCRTEDVLDSSGYPHRGLLTGDDLVDWRATYESPLVLDYRDMVVCKAGAWSQGLVFLQQLAMLKRFDLDAMDPLGPEFVHTITECAKLALADREAYCGDPDFVDVPVSTLLSDAYCAERAALIEETASHTLRPGTVPGYAVRMPEGEDPSVDPTAVGQGSGEPTMGPPGDTCHVDVVDRHGNMVSATPSGGWLQSSPVIPALGFCLGTRAQMFWLDPDVPAALGPGRRPRTTLTPTIVLRDGKPMMALGTPGGDSQDQWSLTLFLRLVHYGMNLQEAIDAPMFNTSHVAASFWPRRANPGHLAIETRFPAATLEALRRRGHALDEQGDWSLGRLSAVQREEKGEDVILKAGANPRGVQGYAAGR